MPERATPGLLILQVGLAAKKRSSCCPYDDFPAFYRLNRPQYPGHWRVIQAGPATGKVKYGLVDLLAVYTQPELMQHFAGAF
jgi:hypothetical protein